MELKKIEKLIEKYLNAETTLQEEEQLREYFGSRKVAPHLEEYIAIFGYFGLAKEENYSGKLHLEPGKNKVYAWVGIAVSILLMAGVFLQEPDQNSEFGSYEDPEIALQKTKETLEMVSKYMNTGKEDLVYLKEFNHTKNRFLKNK